MTQAMYTLVLTGDVLPGFVADQVWSALAAHFRIETQRLHDELLSRAPLAIKESTERASLQRLHDDATRIGAVVEIHDVDADGPLFVLIDNTPRGPLPRGFIAARIAAGVWPPTLRVAAVGSTQWTSFPGAGSARIEGTRSADIPPAAGPSPAHGAADRLGADELLPASRAVHAGFWRRCAAYLIDAAILTVPMVVVNLIPLLGILLGMVGYWLYFALTESSPAQATLGKRAMRIKVTDLRGRRLSFAHATGRFFAAALSVMTLYVGYFIAGWTDRRQALHDLVAGTCVVFREVEPGLALPTVRAPMPWYGWLVNIVLLSVFPLSILAAVSIPAYQDYVARAKVASVAADVAALKIEFAEARMDDEAACPQGPRTIANALVASALFVREAERCSLIVTFAGGDGVPSPLRGQQIEWAIGEDGRWTCSSTMRDRLLPRECR